MEIQSLDNRERVYLRVGVIKAWMQARFYTKAKLARDARLWPNTIGNLFHDRFASAKTVRQLLKVMGDVDIIDHRRHKNGKEE